MPLDPATLDTETPKTLDGRSYPDHLREYEAFDPDLLPLAIELGPKFEIPVLESLAESEGINRLLVSRSSQSATWRGLIERRDEAMTDRAERRLDELGGNA